MIDIKIHDTLLQEGYKLRQKYFYTNDTHCFYVFLSNNKKGYFSFARKIEETGKSFRYLEKSQGFSLDAYKASKFSQVTIKLMSDIFATALYNMKTFPKEP